MGSQNSLINIVTIFNYWSTFQYDVFEGATTVMVMTLTLGGGGNDEAVGPVLVEGGGGLFGTQSVQGYTLVAIYV